jgi:hypothetical protein
VLRFLSEEVVTDVTEGEKYRIDLLVETRLKVEDGLIVIHVESQSQYQRTFNERMFIYFGRLYEKYRRKILPIALFSYNTKEEEPDHFSMDFPFLQVVDFHYLIVQLKKENWRNYIRQDNPAAAALLCKMGYTKREKIEVKMEFLRMLLRLELDPARLTLLTGFFDTYLRINEAEEQKVIEEVKAMSAKEGEKGKQEGKQEGIQEGMQLGRTKR